MKNFTRYTVYSKFYIMSCKQDKKEKAVSYQEKRSVVNVTSTILITTVYAVFMSQYYPAVSAYSPEVFRFWGAFFLILAPVSIIARILIYIVFTAIHYAQTREEKPPVSDERDELIELRAGKRAVYIFIIGLMLAMAALVIEQPPATMFAILICAGVIAEIVGEASQFRFYRRGF